MKYWVDWQISHGPFRGAYMGNCPTRTMGRRFRTIYTKKIDPDNSKAIIAATYLPNHAMYNIITLFNRLPISFLRSNAIGKVIMTIEDTCIWCERPFCSTVPIFWTRHNEYLLTVWQILLSFSLYDAFRGSFNHVAMIIAVVVISILLFGIETLVVQLEEPFSIFPM